MIRRPPRSTQSRSSAASDVYKRTVASTAVSCRMADVASACRRTTRASQQPLSLAEEQAASALSLLEQRDVAAALRLSLQDSWDSDEEKSGAERDDEVESSSSEEEEEKQAAAPAEKKEEWTSELHDIAVPLGEDGVREALQLHDADLTEEADGMG